VIIFIFNLAVEFFNIFYVFNYNGQNLR